MLLLAADSPPTTSFAIPAVVTGVAALVSPTLAVARWIQGKSIKHKCLDEMRRCGDLLEFVKSCPDMLAATNATEVSVLERARIELQESVKRVDALLEAKTVKASPPLEMAWPRRVLLLYAPRTWGATLLHAAYNLVTVGCLLALVSVGYNDDSDAFQWSEYSHVFSNTLFLTGIAFWLFVFFLLWYMATTKDRWDGTLPVSKRQGQKHFLRDTPSSVRDLFARVLLAYSLFDLIFPLSVRTPLKRALISNPLTAAILSASETALWEKVLIWTVACACPLLAYLWAEAEHRSNDNRRWLPFPHNLRFLYPSKGRKEVFAQLSIVLFLGNVAVQFGDVHRSLSVASHLPIPPDDVGAFLAGAMIAPAFDILVLGLLPLYGCYRLGLKSYLSRPQAAQARTSTMEFQPATQAQPEHHS